jgi:nucleoside transporter
MWCIDLLGFQSTPWQFVVSGSLSLLLAAYSLTLPACEIKPAEGNVDLVEALGLKAFTLFKQKKMALFFIFSMMLGMCLQVTNSYANPFITSFGAIEEFANTFGVQHANILISISQICEALCILLIPFFLKRFGIKNVMLIAMFAWVFRFGLFGTGDPGTGVWMFVLSCVVYGFAFDFFNISGSLYVDQEVDPSMRSSAQGIFMMMTNGFGAAIGTLSAQAIVNKTVPTFDWNALGIVRDSANKIMWEALSSDQLLAVQKAANEMWAGWRTAWFIFAAYALVVAILFWIFFENKKAEKK